MMKLSETKVSKDFLVVEPSDSQKNPHNSQIDQE